MHDRGDMISKYKVIGVDKATGVIKLQYIHNSRLVHMSYIKHLKDNIYILCIKLPGVTNRLSNDGFLHAGYIECIFDDELN